ncbi:MAG: hypothetical protein K2X82_26010 [Gemmataceae bacterium]|nr:hypothetical protein [Gemmataceae bacterium]
MPRTKKPKPRFDIGDWVAYGTEPSRWVGRVVEYDSWRGRYPPEYTLFVYDDIVPPELSRRYEDALEPATPEEVAKYSALAAVQAPPPFFRDPQGPRR